MEGVVRGALYTAAQEWKGEGERVAGEGRGGGRKELKGRECEEFRHRAGYFFLGGSMGSGGEYGIRGGGSMGSWRDPLLERKDFAKSAHRDVIDPFHGLVVA